MKKLPVLFLVAASSLLASCSPNEIDSSSNEGLSSITTSETLPEGYSSSVKNYLLALKSIHNYQIEEYVSTSSSTTINTIRSSFTENAFYYDFGDESYGYIKGKDGVYGVSKDGDDLLGSELLLDANGENYSTIWNDDLLPSFTLLDEVSIKELDNGTSGVSIKGKKNKIALLKIFGLDNSYYASITDTKGYITKNNSLRIVMTLSYSNMTVTIEAFVSNLLSTSIPEITSFLDGGGTYFVPNEDLVKARALMQANNYTHNYYDTNGKKVGIEYFNENYYFINWDSSYATNNPDGAILVSQGLIGIDHKKDPNTGNALNGAYLVSISGSQIGISLSFPYNESPNIPYVYHYPSYLSLWSNLERLEADTIPSDLDEYYFIDDSLVVNDFLSNFSLESSVANVKVKGLYFGYRNMLSDTDQLIRFTLDTSGGSLTYDFVDFGSTKIAAFDQFLESLSD